MNKPRFQIGDKVWFVNKNTETYSSFTVSSMFLETDGFHYAITKESTHIHEKKLYATQNEAIDVLIKMHEDKIAKLKALKVTEK